MSDELAPYAVAESTSRGRISPEKTHPYRSDFERDRDRIIHCSAFRRLEGKTQVFSPRLDDYYRTRLTHSIEVAQIARTIAKNLRLNVNLTEAVSLAHDLGHPPFGHAGENALNHLMAEFEGFEHNHQTLRIVEILEHPYPRFTGLNLMYETRLGLAKHQTTYDLPNAKSFTEANCSLEGQIADIADRIAYNCHDLEDGARAGIIKTQQLENLKIFAEAAEHINAKNINDPAILRTRTAKAIIDKLVSDCIDTSSKTIQNANPRNTHDIYQQPENLIQLSPDSNKKLIELEKFLMQNLYLHESVIKTMNKIESWLAPIFEKLCQKPQLMPNYFQQLTEKYPLQRTVCDYIAGMTDSFCLKLLEKIESKHPDNL
ncbi:MAG: deoxyguanosinetriphosphate triphosphohydrolase [Planctomycetota bacterium]|jgi:dGTPase